YSSLGGASRGTVKSALGVARDGGKVLRRGRLQRCPLGRGARDVQMWEADGEAGRGRWRTMRAVPAPLGDLLSAHRTTGIGNITAYVTSPRRHGRAMEWLGPLL